MQGMYRGAGWCDKGVRVCGGAARPIISQSPSSTLAWPKWLAARLSVQPCTGGTQAAAGSSGSVAEAS